MGPIEELHPRELQEILERVSQEGAADVQLIDVREDFEHQTAALPGFKLMPMSRFLLRPQDSVILFAGVTALKPPPLLATRAANLVGRRAS